MSLDEYLAFTRSWKNLADNNYSEVRSVILLSLFERPDEITKGVISFNSLAMRLRSWWSGRSRRFNRFEGDLQEASLEDLFLNKKFMITNSDFLAFLKKADSQTRQKFISIRLTKFTQSQLKQILTGVLQARSKK